MNCSVVIITYRNAANAKSCVLRLLSLHFHPYQVTVVENGSPQHVKDELAVFCGNKGVSLFDICDNCGWGGAINHFVSSLPLKKAHDHVLLIMAHDAYFKRLDMTEMLETFKNPKVIFACPRYPTPSSAKYSILKSYYEVPVRQSGQIQIGQQTAFFARAEHLDRVRYDEEFWVYGGEYEICIRSNLMNYQIYQLENSVIVNPGSAAISNYALLAYKLNSMYLAYKLHGFLGVYIRGSILFANIIQLFLSQEYTQAKLLGKILVFSLMNPGCGHRTYVKNGNLQKKFEISILNE
jgi:GT2 family glycosyltransferase